MDVRLTGVFLCLALSAGSAAAQEPGPPADDKPVARIEVPGPLSYVSSLAFSPDGETLYAAGWDKRVHVWSRGDAENGFTYQRGLAFRVPLGPGQHGHINALAVSPDGRWLAVGGYGMARNVSGFRESGKIWPKSAMTDAMRLDIGQIYVFDTRTRAARVLRGHMGTVVALEFAPAAAGQPALLLSAGREESTGDPTGSVRVWDVDTATEVAKLTQSPVPATGPASGWEWKRLPDPGGWKPQLAVWYAPGGENRLRVAIAWGDNDDPVQPRQGRFRVWDVATGRVSAAAATPYTLAVLALPTNDRQMLTGAYGQIGLWTAAPGGRPELVQLDQASHYSTVLRLDGARLPRAAAQIGSAPQAAFVVEHRQANRADYELLLVDLNRGERLGQPLPLWSGAIRGPVLAASRNGRLLALSGAETNEIRIYDTQQLGAGRVALVQTLRPSDADARPLRSVAFVSNQQGDLGLSLSEAAPGEAQNRAAGRLLFDIAQGRVANAQPGWNTNAPDTGNLAAQFARAADGTFVVEVRRGGGVARRITLEENSQPTALAICPAGEHFPVPLVAIAAQFRGEPILGIYNAETGEELRRLTGHIEPVRSVAFSADGALLASAADDWTVCVWRLTDIDETLGKIGLLQGLAVERHNERLIVRDDPEGPLESQDEIAGVLEQDAGVTRLDSTWDFYQNVSRRKPDSTISLRVIRNGQPRVVEATIAQGIDERKPLFTLFITPDRRSWIGWHPVGKYDAGDRGAERYLGWHFNTGRADQPARFAAAEQYREDNFAPGLLQNLIAGQPPVAAEPPEPKISLHLVPHEGDALERNDYEGYLLSRTPDITAIVRVEEMPARFIQDLEWSFDGGDFRPATARQQTDRSTWEIDLSEAGWDPRRVQKVAVRLVARGLPPGTFPLAGESVLYLPPPPKIAIDGPDELKNAAGAIASTREGTLRIVSRVKAQRSGEPFTVELKRQEQVVGRWTSPDGADLRVEQEVELASGGNVLLLTARNAAADRDPREAVTQSWLVNSLLEPEPPAFVWNQVLPASGGESFKPVAAGAAGAKRFVVHVPQIRIQGRVEAPAELLTADYQIDPRKADASAHALAGFEPRRSKSLDVDEPLRLRPGRQTVRFRARTTAGKEAVDDIEFEYRPELPTIVAAELTIPGDPAETREITPGEAIDLVHRPGLERLELTADLVLPPDVHSFQAEAALDDQPLPADAVRLEDGRRLHVTLPFSPDAQRSPDTRRVHIRLTNEWSPQPYRAPSLAITYRHPPRILQVSEPEAEGLRIPLLRCVLQSPESRPVEAVTVSTNGRPLPDSQMGEIVRQGDGQWALNVRDIPLEPGPNEIVFVARNSDGASAPHRMELEGQLPASPLPEIELVSPAVDQATSSSRLTVEFRVRSARPLRMVDLVVRSAAGDLQRIHALDELGPADPQGFAAWKGTVELSGGANMVSVEAVSDGLSVAGPVVLNVLPAPVELLVDRLVPLGRQGEALLPDYRPDGVHFDEPLPAGRATLYGHVSAADGSDNADEYQLVRVWVNGFLRIAPVKNGAFELPVVLNQSANRMQLEVPYQAVDEANRYRHQQVHVDCAAPEEGQHLHLLVIGAEPRTAAETLRERVEGAFHLKDGNRAFIYQPPPRVLAGDRATRHHIRAQLMMLRWRMARRPGTDQSNDVLMIYYEGRAVEREGQFVLLDQVNWRDPDRDLDSAITSRFLSEYVNETPGAHLVLLDVEANQSNPLAAPERWPPHLGVLGIVRSEAPGGATDLISAIGNAIPGSASAASEEIRLRSLQAALEETFAGRLVHASEDLRNLLLARAGGAVATP